MPFIRRNFGPIGSPSRPITSGTPESVPGVPMLWGFRTADAVTVVDAGGYFNEVASLLAVGDVILITYITGAGALSTVSWHVVRSIVGTVVDVTDATAISVVNTRA